MERRVFKKTRRRKKKSVQQAKSGWLDFISGFGEAFGVLVRFCFWVNLMKGNLLSFSSLTPLPLRSLSSCQDATRHRLCMRPRADCIEEKVETEEYKEKYKGEGGWKGERERKKQDDNSRSLDLSPQKIGIPLIASIGADDALVGEGFAFANELPEPRWVGVVFFGLRDRLRFEDDKFGHGRAGEEGRRGSLRNDFTPRTRERERTTRRKEDASRGGGHSEGHRQKRKGREGSDRRRLV